jgi:NDP-sugar pyrophosphorylase family protein
MLLETGGGIKNASEQIGGTPFLVYNGDVLADFPLEGLMRIHLRSGRIATMALRSSGGERHIQCDPATGLVTDMRGLIGGAFKTGISFTGISVFSPEIFEHISAGEVVLIIPILVDLMRRGFAVGGEIIDEGVWFDIGTILPTWQGVRELLNRRESFSYLPADWLKPVEDGAIVQPGARIQGCSAVAVGAEVGARATLENVILWPGAKVDADAALWNAVVTPEGVCKCDPESDSSAA